MTTKSKAYRKNVTTSDAFYTMRVFMGVIISLLLTIIGIINCGSHHTLIMLLTAAAAVSCIALVFRFLWCYYALQKGKHVGKDIGHA